MTNGWMNCSCLWGLCRLFYDSSWYTPVPGHMSSDLILSPWLYLLFCGIFINSISQISDSAICSTSACVWSSTSLGFENSAFIWLLMVTILLTTRKVIGWVPLTPTQHSPILQTLRFFLFLFLSFFKNNVSSQSLAFMSSSTCDGISYNNTVPILMLIL